MLKIMTIIVAMVLAAKTIISFEKKRYGDMFTYCLAIITICKLGMEVF